MYALGTSSADGSQDPAKANSLLGTPTVGPCAQVTCHITTQPDPAPVNSPFSIYLNYTYNAGPQGRPIQPKGSLSYNRQPAKTHTFAASNSGGSWLVGDDFVAPGPGSYHADGQLVPAAGIGNYNVTCTTDDINVAAQPYVRFYGNGVAAGSIFDTGHNNCSSGQTAVTSGATPAFWTFNKVVTANGTSYYGGGGAQLGVFAKGQNFEFASASNRNGQTSGPNPATGLSFGNMIKTNTGASQSIAAGNYGGELTMQHCIPDYFAASTTAAATTAPNQVIRGNFTLTNDMLINDGTQQVIFVDGDAYLGHRIAFAGTNWANPSRIPSFYLVVRGNIYIDSSVRQLDGVYVAQPKADGSAGTIYTCANNVGGGGLYAPNALYASCQNQLTVTGSFIAKQVRYQRTKGDTSTSIASAATVPDPVGWMWSSAGLPVGADPANCARVVEWAVPGQYTWQDNYLCTTTNKGLYWLWSGTGGSYDPVTGHGKKNSSDVCALVNPPTEPSQYTWGDNYICAPQSAGLDLTFVNTDAGGSLDGKNCINITESADPNWMRNWNAPGMYSPYYICISAASAPSYTPTNEDPSSGNIAEVFNFSAEMYLAPQPKVLESVTGGGTGIGKNYNAVTSLPPVL